MKKILFFTIFYSVLGSVFFLAGCDDGISTNNDVASDPEIFVSAQWLAQNISNDNIVVADARDYSTAYALGHIKDAISLQWQLFASMAPLTSADIGFGELLPDAEVIEKIAESGIKGTDTVVVYATANAGWGEAGRIAWMLLMAGIETKILNGGIAAWELAGNTLSTDITTLSKSDFSVTSLDQSYNITTEYLNTNKESVIILDTRTKAEYDGDTSSYGSLDGGTHGGWGEKAFGHVPGAVHAPFTDLFEANGTLKSDSDLLSLFTSWGLINKNSVIVPYCTGGLRSAYMALILRDFGYKNAKNYDASFWGWTASDLQVE